MTRFGLTESHLSLIKDAVDQFSEIESAVLFGSRAMGNFKKGSDVDIAVKGKEFHSNTISRLSALLNEELPLPYFFDIVHYDTLDSTALIEHIDQQGVLL